MRDQVPATSRLAFFADYADDGVDGGTPKDVWEALRGEMAMAEQYGVKFNFGKMVVYTVAGDEFEGDLSEFERLGIRIDRSQNITFMKAIVQGSEEFIRTFCEDKLEQLQKAYDGIKHIEKKHVGFYLLTHSAAKPLI